MTLGRVNAVNGSVTTTFTMVAAMKEASLGMNLRRMQCFYGDADA